MGGRYVPVFIVHHVRSMSIHVHASRARTPAPSMKERKPSKAMHASIPASPRRLSNTISLHRAFVPDTSHDIINDRPVRAGFPSKVVQGLRYFYLSRYCNMHTGTVQLYRYRCLSICSTSLFAPLLPGRSKKILHTTRNRPSVRYPASLFFPGWRREDSFALLNLHLSQWISLVF